jgi:PAS domain S-box-containing protein
MMRSPQAVAINFAETPRQGPIMHPPDMLADAVLATKSDAIIAADRKGMILFWNPGAERIFGYASAAAIGQSLDIIIPERLRKRHWEGYHHVIETGESRYGDGDILAVPALRQDGSGISVEFTIVPLRDETGRLSGMAAILRDVTKRFEETRALKQKLAEAMKASG